MIKERFSWHPEAVLFTAKGKCISARDHQLESTTSSHILSEFFKLLHAGHAPLVKSDGTVEPGPLPAKENMFYSASGGSTGMPKLVCRSCRSWLLSFAENNELFDIRKKKSYATLGHPSHSLTLYAALEALNTGADYYPLGDIRVTKQLSILLERKVKIIYATPTQLRLLLRFSNKSIRLIGVQWLVIGGGWLDDETMGRLQDFCPNAEILQFYGAAETSFITMSNRWTPDGSVGQAYHDVEIKLMNDQNQRVQTGEIGEIWVKSPYLFSHYADPSKQYVKWHDGWLSIGEIGKLDAKGNLFLEGRKSRAFKIADQNIYPEKLEAALCQHPDIFMAFVFDAPDKMRGANAIAVIATKSGKIPTDIMKWSQSALGARSRPARFLYLAADQWPLLPSGKLDMIALKVMAGEMI